MTTFNQQLICRFLMDCLKEARAAGLDELQLAFLMYADMKKGELIMTADIGPFLLVSPERASELMKEMKALVVVETVDSDFVKLQPTEKGAALVERILGL